LFSSPFHPLSPLINSPCDAASNRMLRPASKPNP
jgi:hypothetical protein